MFVCVVEEGNVPLFCTMFHVPQKILSKGMTSVEQILKYLLRQISH